MSRPVKVAFASASDELIGPFLERIELVYPDLELYVVSEFPSPRGRWIPYRLSEGFRHNLARCRGVLEGRDIRLSAVVLQPSRPHFQMRMIAVALAPLRTLFYNENLDHFMLRPHAVPNIARHLLWRVRAHVWWQTHPGGDLYTFLWRLRHPREFRRPIYSFISKLAGSFTAVRKRLWEPVNPPPLLSERQPDGISIVIPSRTGRSLLGQLLPLLKNEIGDTPAEIIVVDNGSDDGTVPWLQSEYPKILIEFSAAPLSFARAVNRGIARARFSRICLLNNDMKPHPGFLNALSTAFLQVPDLFCATAQIFFPEGERRQETGKAIMPAVSLHQKDTGFPIRCDLPLPGEDLSYVLYGSGGCSMYDTNKLRTLGGLGELYEPAYVEDLDAGVRAWRRGWPTVFVASARVTHQHRATTSRFYSDEDLERVVELNYLRFLARGILSHGLFRRFWARAIHRLNLKHIAGNQAALPVLSQAVSALRHVERPFMGAVSDELIFAIGSGDVAVFPGRARHMPVTVLIASPYEPFPLSHGGAVRMYNLMKRAAVGYGQVLVTFVDELHTPPPELLDICVEVVQVRRHGSHDHPFLGRPEVVEEFDSMAFRAALRETLRKWRPALAQLEFTQMAQYATGCRPAKTLLVEHDITIDLYRQLLEQAGGWEVRTQLALWEKFETEAWRNLDCIVTMSEKDRRSVLGAKRVAALPNGVDLQRFRPGQRNPGSRRLLFIGSFAHLPNVVAAAGFLRDVWPLLDDLAPVLHIIAGARHRYYYERYRDRVEFVLDLPRVEVEDFVADVRPAYERAAIVIAPLLASAGTNIKIMEAMAMGKAIVSTAAGINALDELEPGVDVIVEREPAGMAAAIRRLLEDPEQRTALEERARASAERHFDWDRIAARQSALYESLL